MSSAEGKSALPSLQAIPRPTKTYHTQTYPRIALVNVDFDGKGKTVFITGGATGIGEATVYAFAKAGVERIVIMSRSPEPLEKIKADLKKTYPKTKVITYSASVTDLPRVTEILHEVSQIDILILCATAVHALLPGHEVSDDSVEDVYRTNVLAPFNMTKTYLTLPTPASGHKTLLNVSSGSAHVCIPNQLAYGSSKAAFVQILQHLAAEQRAKPANEQVRMITYHPGAIYTPLAAKMIPKDAFDWEDVKLPADFAVWLAGGQSGFLHGRFVWAQWDVEDLVALKEKIGKDPGFLTIGLVQ